MVSASLVPHPFLTPCPAHSPPAATTGAPGLLGPWKAWQVRVRGLSLGPSLRRGFRCMLATRASLCLGTQCPGSLLLSFLFACTCQTTGDNKRAGEERRSRKLVQQLDLGTLHRNSTDEGVGFPKAAHEAHSHSISILCSWRKVGAHCKYTLESWGRGRSVTGT